MEVFQVAGPVISFLARHQQKGQSVEIRLALEKIVIVGDVARHTRGVTCQRSERDRLSALFQVRVGLAQIGPEIAIEGHLAVEQRLGGERAGEGLGDRTDLVQRPSCRQGRPGLRDRAIIIEAAASVIGDHHRQADMTAIREEGRCGGINGAVHGRSERIVGGNAGRCRRGGQHRASCDEMDGTHPKGPFDLPSATFVALQL